MKIPSDKDLLHRFEPVMRYTAGEEFFPMSVDAYINRSSLWVKESNQPEAKLLIPEGKLSTESLCEPCNDSFGAIRFLKFIEPLNISDLAAYRLRQGIEELTSHKDPKKVFHPGRGRLARVGYWSRFIDAIFSITLLARGRVPGDTATAASLTYQSIMQENQHHIYYGRVLRRDGWIILQYWFFYAYNNWRSGFFGVNDHEADWEMIAVYLYEEDKEKIRPEWVAYASHDHTGDDIRRRWDDPELERIGEHPIVYVGAGSHACYFSPGEYLTEMEIPFLAPYARLVDWVQKQSKTLIKVATGDDLREKHRDSFNFFRVPFVDYARGDGVSIGPGQEFEWDQAQIIEPPPDWVLNYRGLWGLYAQDPLAGEDAPAGPMYNRDGSVRQVWYDPLGWVGLDRVAPPHESTHRARHRYQKIKNRIDSRLVLIQEKSNQLQYMDIEARAMQAQPHMERIHRAHVEEMGAISDELNQMRVQDTKDQALLQALERYIVDHERGVRHPPRAHIRREMKPLSSENLRISRMAEFWSAISIGLMMISFVGIVLLARQYLLAALTALISLVIFIESGFRKRLARLITGVTTALAIVTALVLLYEFFWEIIIICVLIAGAYIMWENLRELLTRRRK
jgi:hypothetical protein